MSLNPIFCTPSTEVVLVRLTFFFDSTTSPAAPDVDAEEEDADDADDDDCVRVFTRSTGLDCRLRKYEDAQPCARFRAAMLFMASERRIYSLCKASELLF